MAALQFQTHEERNHRRGVAFRLQVTHDRVQEALESRKTLAEAQQKQQDWANRNKGFEEPDLLRCTGYVLLGLGLVAVYCLDYLLFSATADYFARSTFYDWPVMVAVARFLIPAVILTVEVMVSLYMYFARDEESRDLDSSFPSWAWEVVGILLALAMPQLQSWRPIWQPTRLCPTQTWQRSLDGN